MVSIRKSCSPVCVCPRRRDVTRSPPHHFRILTLDGHRVRSGVCSALSIRTNAMRTLPECVKALATNHLPGVMTSRNAARSGTRCGVAWRKSGGNPASARRRRRRLSGAAAWDTSGCHVTPVTTNSGKRRSTSRRTTSTIANPVPGNQVQLPGMPLFIINTATALTSSAVAVLSVNRLGLSEWSSNFWCSWR